MLCFQIVVIRKNFMALSCTLCGKTLFSWLNALIIYKLGWVWAPNQEHEIAKKWKHQIILFWLFEQVSDQNKTVRASQEVSRASEAQQVTQPVQYEDGGPVHAKPTKPSRKLPIWRSRFGAQNQYIQLCNVYFILHGTME